METAPADDNNRLRLWMNLALAAIVLIVFGQTATFQFIFYDDNLMIFRNEHVTGGITLDSLKWAFTGASDYWDPITRLSHIFLYQLFGDKAGFHHAANVLIHMGAVALLFDFLFLATGKLWRSFFVTLVFAIHPLQVEGVVWATQRGALLCTLFWFLSLREWVRYTRTEQQGHYRRSIVYFALAMCCKPLAVTMPLVLLLLDHWPLRRGFSRQRFIEKIPFGVISIAGAIGAMMTQSEMDAVRTLAEYPVQMRAGNILMTYATFVHQLFWPSGLSVIYPYPTSFTRWPVVGAVLTVGLMSYLVYKFFKPFRWLTVGWAWFLIVLLPMVGILQVGIRARTDHSMYVPIIGLAIMLAWAGRYMISNRPLAVSLASVAAVAMATASVTQTRYWKDSETVFRRAVAVNNANSIALENLGWVLLTTPDHVKEAEAVYREALRLDPKSVDALTGLGNTLSVQKRFDEAETEFQKALAIRQNSPATLEGLGALVGQIPGREQEAVGYLTDAVAGNPNLRLARRLLGLLLVRQGRPDDGLFLLEPFVEGSKNQFEVQYEAGRAMARIPEKLEAGIRALELAVQMRPKSADAQGALGAALLQNPKRQAEGVEHLGEAVKLAPENFRAHNNWGSALTKVGRFPQAMAEFTEALRLEPRYIQAHIGIGALYEKWPGHMSQALGEYLIAFEGMPIRGLALKIRSLGGKAPLPDEDEPLAAPDELQDLLNSTGGIKP